MQKFNVDVQRPSVPLVVYAKQQDTVRKVELTLYENGVPFVPPASAAATVWYKTPAGEGNYDATISGNKIELTLIEQMLANAGNGIACVVLHDVNKEKLGLWNMEIVIEGVPALESAVASEWFTALDDKISQALDAANRAEQAAASINPNDYLDTATYKGSAVGIVKTADDANSLGGKEPAYYYPIRRNLLDNWYFKNPVNQRGIKSHPETFDYGIDRWVGGNYSIVKGNYVSLASGSTMFQRLGIVDELGIPLERTLLFSCLTDDGKIHTATGTFKNEINIVDDGITFTAKIDTGYPSGHLMYVGLTATDAAKNILAAKLELGDTQTLAHQENGKWVLNEIPDYGEELRKCQRYYWEVDKGNGASAVMMRAAAVSILTGNVSFPVTLRKTGGSPKIILSQVRNVLTGAIHTLTPTDVLKTSDGVVYIGAEFIPVLEVGGNYELQDLIVDANL